MRRCSCAASSEAESSSSAPPAAAPDRRRHVVRPLSYLLAGRPLYNFRVIGADILRRAGVPGPGDVEETGDTFAENAEIKARAFARCAAALPIGERPDFVLADDSGLAVDALDAPNLVLLLRRGEEVARWDDLR